MTSEDEAESRRRVGIKQANLAREEVLCTGSLTQIQWDHLDTKA